MSFSSNVKDELCRQYSKSRHCQLAEIAGILELTGNLNDNFNLEIETDNPALIEKYAILMKTAFSLDITKPISREETLRILAALKWINRRNEIHLPINEQRTNGLLVQKTCCKRAFIRGAFLAAGSMSDPNKSYHFEIVCKTGEQAEQLKELMIAFETDAKIVERKGHYVVYLKEGAQIVDMLNVMEAYVSLMNLENVRILKEMRNSVNRQVNCETANINKTVSAAVRQIEDINILQDAIGLDNLPDNLREMAYLRLEYPDAPLKDLGQYLDPPVGKSGVNHRLRKLSELADKYR
ncbi:MAG: DNA-binding protein WhiA [Agathobacter sp.]|nr:DNA-binding protein WhiA [Agathobacter sp.]